MDLLNPVKPFMAVYNVFDRMKMNKDQNPHILSRLDALQELVVFVQKKEPHQLSDNVHKALEKLNTILVSAKEVLERFEKTNVMVHAMKASDYKAEFEQLNKSLTDAFVTLSSALHIHQENKLDEQENKLVEQQRKLATQERMLEEQEKELSEQRKNLDEQDEKLEEQEKELFEQRKNLDEQDGKLVEQQKKLARQEKMLKEQEDKLAGQEDLLLQLESKVMNESRAFYCVLL